MRSKAMEYWHSVHDHRPGRPCEFRPVPVADERGRTLYIVEPGEMGMLAVHIFWELRAGRDVTVQYIQGGN